MTDTARSPDRRTQLTSTRWKRPNVWLGKLIPSLLLVFAVKGYSLVLREVLPLVYRRNPLSGLAYCGWVHGTLFLTGYSYFSVYFQSLDPPAQREAPAAVQEKRVAHACDSAGEPVRCYRDRCDGAWQSIRTRHCRDCGTCREHFDHHCSFMDNCVSAATFKPFFTFLVYAALLLAVALVPLAPLQLRACREVIRTTWSALRMQEAWWGKWWSWAGGPVFRYAGALFLGYRHYLDIAHTRPLLVQDVEQRTLVRDGRLYTYEAPLYPSLAIPRLSTLVIVLFATMICSIAVAMIFVIVRNSRTGDSAVQIERTRRWRLQQGVVNPDYDARFRLWIPLPKEEHPVGGAVVLVEPDVPLFDLGPAENWRRLMGERWWQWFVPWVPSRLSDFDLNPQVLASLQEQARKEQ